jgi:hypothetical protein
VRAVVEKARYSDPRATTYLTDTLIKRRDKVLRAWLNIVNPSDEPALTASGALTWRNVAVAAGMADAAQSYTLRWFAFNNATHEKQYVADAQTVSVLEASAPASLLQSPNDYIGVTITAQHPQQTAWAKPATFYFRRSGGGWTWVGAERD